ncbi:MAG TPA: chromate efflux transporter [Gemmatimonadota bacterium]|nr:chromate efflux transporter [Gemmatimonadota bacterium]
MPGTRKDKPTRGASVRSHDVTFGEAFRVWLRVAALSFGGPSGQIAVMQRILVDEKRWVSQRRFFHALSYCMLLPGPEAQQLAIYIGWLLHGVPGGLVAGVLFVLPGFLSILVLSILYAIYQEIPAVEALFFGLKAAVLAVVVEALFRIGERALRNMAMIAVAAASFVAIFFFQVPFPMIIAGAALTGWLGERLRRGLFVPSGDDPTPEAGRPGMPIGDTATGSSRPPMVRLVRVSAVWLTIWSLPFLAVLASVGADHVLFTEAVFFSKMAMVTFGGAYAVLAYIAQEAVGSFGWLRPGEMLDGLGLAETTPGPLIQVAQFVGFLGAYRNPGALDPMTAAILGSIVTTWVTFVPCFLWIFAGAPYIEWLRGRRALSAALSGITAAVVGVVLNLAVWFAVHTVFEEVVEARRIGIRLLLPVWETVDLAALTLATAAFIALFRMRWGMIPTLAATAATGMAVHLLLRG